MRRVTRALLGAVRRHIDCRVGPNHMAEGLKLGSGPLACRNTERMGSRWSTEQRLLHQDLEALRQGSRNGFLGDGASNLCRMAREAGYEHRHRRLSRRQYSGSCRSSVGIAPHDRKWSRPNMPGRYGSFCKLVSERPDQGMRGVMQHERRKDSKSRSRAAACVEQMQKNDRATEHRAFL